MAIALHLHAELVDPRQFWLKTLYMAFGTWYAGLVLNLPDFQSGSPIQSCRADVTRIIIMIPLYGDEP